MPLPLPLLAEPSARAERGGPLRGRGAAERSRLRAGRRPPGGAHSLRPAEHSQVRTVNARRAAAAARARIGSIRYGWRPERRGRKVNTADVATTELSSEFRSPLAAGWGGRRRGVVGAVGVVSSLPCGAARARVHFRTPNNFVAAILDLMERARSLAAALGRIATLTSLDLSNTDIGAEGARSSRRHWTRITAAAPRSVRQQHQHGHRAPCGGPSWRQQARSQGRLVGRLRSSEARRAPG
jgi:hypothetical protein